MKQKSIQIISIGFLLLFALVVYHFLAGKWSFEFLENDFILNFIRIPRTLTAIFCGALLAVSGLMLQILFSNPLAGPSILGISSGASLGVAIAVLLGLGNLTLTGASFLGALIYSLILLLIGKFVKTNTSLLLVGIMLSGFTSAFIEVLQVYAQESQLKFFTLWGMGSLQQVSQLELLYFIISLLFVIVVGIYIANDLTVFIQGEDFAKSLGVNIQAIRWLIIIVSSISVAVTTAFCGPISFVGIAVPNLVRMLFKTANAKILFIGCLVFGPILMLLCDSLVLALDEWFILPINSMTALIGSPFIIWVILKQVR